MRVVVCELPGDDADRDAAWDALVAHARAARPDLVLLPELAFAPWLPCTHEVDGGAWDDAVAAAAEREQRVAQLGATVVAWTRPTSDGTGRREGRGNEAVVWDAEAGVRPVHRKTYLPDEPGFWEATWYGRGPTSFAPVDTPVGRIGFAVCTELWFTEHARAYSAAGVDLVLCPRGTPVGSVEKWVAGGRVAGVVAGAFCLSSNRVGPEGDAALGGVGWVTDPEGEVCARTSPEAPFATVDVDLAAARAAKRTYPRYVDDTPLGG